MSTTTLITWLLLGAIAHLPGEEFYHPGTSGAAQLSVDSGVAVARVQGTPEEMGSQLAAMTTTAVNILLRTLVHQVDEQALGEIPPGYRGELQAIAASVGIDAKVLATANLIVDRRCSALVYQEIATEGTKDVQPLLVARNMDYAPAALLGPSTLVTIYRGTGVHAFASIGWPGCCGVVSGMNDAGVTVCVLLNDARTSRHAGEPICFRLREMLEQSLTLEGAVRIFSASAVASEHFVVVADRLTACVIWNDGVSVHRQGLVHGWLTCTNAPRTESGDQLDTRAAYLGKLIAGTPATTHPDTAWLRRALTGCYLNGVNAQSMLLIPATLSLQVSLGTATAPAALGTWHAIELAPLLHGEPFPVPLQTSLGAVPEPLPHYTAR